MKVSRIHQTVGGAARRRAALLGLTLLVGLLVAACGSSKSSSSSSAGGSTSASSASGSSSGSISSSTLASLKASITKAEAVPKFVAPGPAVNASAVKGSSMLVMPVNSEIDACQTQSEDFVALGKSLGVKVTYFSDSGEPSQWVQGIQNSVSGHDKAIALLCGIIPGAVGPQLTAARRAGVTVVDGNYNEVSDYTGLDGETAVDVAGGMKDDVDDALINLNGKPLHALVVTTDSIVQGPAAIAAVNGEIKRVCPSSCSATDVIVPIQNWATQVQSDVSSALVKNSNINAVIVTFDGMTQFVLPAVTSAHNSALKIYAWGAGRSVEKLIKPGGVVVADSGPDEQWDAYEAMDQIIRIANHKPAASVTQEVDPNRFWDASNVKSFFGPGGTYGNEGYGGDAFINGFKKLWNVP